MARGGRGGRWVGSQLPSAWDAGRGLDVGTVRGQGSWLGSRAPVVTRGAGPGAPHMAGFDHTAGQGGKVGPRVEEARDPPCPRATGRQGWGAAASILPCARRVPVTPLFKVSITPNICSAISPVTLTRTRFNKAINHS